MKLEKPLLTIAVLSFNNCDQVVNLIKFLMTCDKIRKCEIIIVDDGSTYNQIPIRALDLCDNITLHTKIYNRGVAHSRNVAARMMESDYIIYLDSDLKIDSSLWIDKTLQKISSGNIDYMGDNKYDIRSKDGHPYWKSLFFINGIVKLFYNNVDFYYENDTTFCFHMINGHGMTIHRRMFFERDLWFDETYVKSGVEDMDFCLQAYVRGIIPNGGLYISVEFFKGRGAAMARSFREDVVVEAYNRNKLHFVKKWSDLLSTKQFVDKYFRYNNKFVSDVKCINLLEEDRGSTIVLSD